MARYSITDDTDSDPYFMHFDGVQATAPIIVEYDDDGEPRFESMPYQTADANHDIEKAADLVVAWVYRDEPDSAWPISWIVEDAAEPQGEDDLAENRA